jgi:iron-sulfur cluster insertion protein
METATQSYAPNAPAEAAPAGSIIVTDSAAARIIKITRDEPTGTRFRISVLGGGCSGFQYRFDLDSQPSTETDILFEKNGALVVTDDVSIGFLAGSTLDYVEDLGSAGFELKNPKATAKCGCGNSFSV